MTVSAQVKQTLAELKNVHAMLDMFALHQGDKSSKAIYSSESQKIAQVIGQLEHRIGQLEFEESQYKGL